MYLCCLSVNPADSSDNSDLEDDIILSLNEWGAIGVWDRETRTTRPDSWRERSMWMNRHKQLRQDYKVQLDKRELGRKKDGIWEVNWERQQSIASLEFCPRPPTTKEQVILGEADGRSQWRARREIHLSKRFYRNWISEKNRRFVYDIVLYYTVGLMSGKRCLYRHNNNWGYNFFHFDFIKALSKVYPLIWTILYFLECWMATAICRILFLDWETEWSYFWLWIGKAVLADSNILFYTASIPMWPAED